MQSLPVEAQRKDQHEESKNRPQADLRKLNRQFVSMLLEDFNRSGQEALETFRETKPDKYCQLVASFIPREQTLNVNSKSEHNVKVDASLENTARLLQSLAHKASEGPVIDVFPEQDEKQSDPVDDPY